MSVMILARGCELLKKRSVECKTCKNSAGRDIMASIDCEYSVTAASISSPSKEGVDTVDIQRYHRLVYQAHCGRRDAKKCHGDDGFSGFRTNVSSLLTECYAVMETITTTHVIIA